METRLHFQSAGSRRHRIRRSDFSIRKIRKIERCCQHLDLLIPVRIPATLVDECYSGSTRKQNASDARQTQQLMGINTMSTTTITPYLFFAGRCDEALQFYSRAIGAQVDLVMRFNESPDPVPPGMLQPGFESKVMHASFRVGDVLLMASDGCDDKSKFDGFRLALSVPSEAEAHKAFNALAEGGTIQMPLSKTFWSPCYGMVTDRFSVGWMVMVRGQTEAQH
jgi:PhnB protein